MRLINLAERNPFQNFERRRCWHRETAVGAIDPAASLVQRRNKNFFNPKRLDPDAGTDDVGDRIECANFVKADILRRNTVDLSLCLSDPPKDGEGPLFDKGRECAALDQLTNLAMAAAMHISVFMRVLMLMPVLMLIPVFVSVSVLMLMFMPVLVGMCVFVRVAALLAFVRFVLFVVLVSMLRAFVDPELDPTDPLSLFPFEVHMEIPET